MTDLDLVKEALTLHPGDTLVIRVAPHTTYEQASAMREELNIRLDNVPFTIVGCEQLAVIRKGEDEVEETT